jgi:hypothetical protein
MWQSNGEGRWSEGTYENSYVNEDGIWRIAALHFYVTMICEYDKGWIAGDIPMDGPSDTLPPDSPPTEVYGSLPEVYLPPYHYPNPVTGVQPAKPSLPELAAGSADGLAGEVLALSKRVERLEDQRACEKLQRSYSYYVD